MNLFTCGHSATLGYSAVIFLLQLLLFSLSFYLSIFIYLSLYIYLFHSPISCPASPSLSSTVLRSMAEFVVWEELAKYSPDEGETLGS